MSVAVATSGDRIHAVGNTRAWRSILLVFGLLVSGLAERVTAHEFWLEPEAYQPGTGDPLVIEMRNGENFDGETLPYTPALIRNFRHHSRGPGQSVLADVGDTRLSAAPGHQPGLQIVQYQSVAHHFTHKSVSSFLRYAREEGAEAVANAGLLRMGTPERVHEIYSRHAKLLTSRGQATGNDRFLGMELELIALDNPYSSEIGDLLRIRLRHQGRPLPDAQVTVFRKRPGQAAARNVLTTDGHGVVAIRYQQGFHFLVNAVFLEAVDPLQRVLRGGDFESHWASLTFSTRQSAPEP